METLSPHARATVLQGGLRIAWYVGLAVFVVQFILLVIHSAYLWDRFDLTADFGQYSQAWQQTGRGTSTPTTRPTPGVPALRLSLLPRPTSS